MWKTNEEIVEKLWNFTRCGDGSCLGGVWREKIGFGDCDGELSLAVIAVVKQFLRL
jgi:hypothetical protein